MPQASDRRDALTEEEQLVAKQLFENIIQTACLDLPCIKYILSPMSVFNGDFLLASQNGSGDLYIMLGDFTGHGLPAAVGTIPVAEIFYTMTKKGFSLQAILQEINKKLRSILPTGFFCAANLLMLNAERTLLQSWNGGLPAGLVYRKGVGFIDILKSAHLPLGVCDDIAADTPLQTVHIQTGDRIYCFSDGLLEAQNTKGERFGSDRLRDIFDSEQSLFEDLKEALLVFTAGEEQHDDITLIELEV